MRLLVILLCLCCCLESYLSDDLTNIANDRIDDGDNYNDTNDKKHNVTNITNTIIDDVTNVTTSSLYTVTSITPESGDEQSSPDVYGKKISIRKCCQPDEIYAKSPAGTKGCAKPDANNWPYPSSPSLAVDIFNSTTKRYRSVRTDRLEIVYGFNCTEKASIRNHSLTEAGELYDNAYPNAGAYEKYCLDIISWIDNLTHALVCFDSDISSSSNPLIATDNLRLIKTICLRISAVFCFLTFLVYALVPKLRNVQGKVVMMQLISLTVAYFDLSCITAYIEMKMFACRLTAFVMQFFFLGSFFWLNVMCFDLWWTFSGYRSFGGSIKQKDTKKLVTYSIYAWGSPVIITIVTLLAEFWPAMPDVFVRPQIGKLSCWFYSGEAKVMYFYGPTFLLLMANMFMFLHTTSIIIRHKRESKVLKRSGSRRHSDKNDQQRFFVYLNLFIVMGVNWIAEVISYFVKSPVYLWYVTDVGNSLGGLFIFIIFICKRRVFRLLIQTFYPESSIFRDSSKSKSSHSTSVSSLSSNKINSKNSIRLKISNVEEEQRDQADFVA